MNKTGYFYLFYLVPFNVYVNGLNSISLMYFHNLVLAQTVVYINSVQQCTVSTIYLGLINFVEVCAGSFFKNGVIRSRKAEKVSAETNSDNE